MNILFFDTETTGKPKNYKAPLSDLENWPRLVQLGFVWMEDGAEDARSFEFIVKPDGFEIPAEVSKIHGITQERALQEGTSLKVVLACFAMPLHKADLLVGHNLSFDLNVLGAEYLRVGEQNPLEGKATYDTMLRGTNFCKIPGSYGKYKWPKLEELYQKLFDMPLAQTHTALDDIENTAACYFKMKALGL